jgi:hypothetical protein
MQNAHLKTISLALMLLVASWGAKQFFVSMAIFGAGGAMDEAVLDADLTSDWYDETREDRVERAIEQADKSPDQEDIAKLSDDIDDVRKDIFEEDDVIEDMVDAKIAEKAGIASALNMTQWFLRLKMLLDLVKIAAVFLLIKGALGLIEDKETDSTTRWFAIGTTVVVLFSILVTGVLSFFA